MIIEKLQQFAEAVSVRLYVKRPAPMEQDWRLNNWVFPCIVAIPAQDSETVQETSVRVERRDFELMALRSVDVTFDTAEADAETEIARTEVLDFAQQIRGVFHVEHLGGRQIWDSANGELIVGWSLRLRLTELVGESACGGEPEPAEIEITENGTYNVLPFGRAVVDVQGGTPAVVEPLEVTPDTEAHTYTPPAGVDGFAPVVVGACPVCPAADVRPLYVVPSRDSQTFSPVGFDGFAPVEVQGYDPVLQAKTTEPATTAQTITPDAGYDGLSSVNVDAVTAAIDANIVAGNIKKNVQILGVTGTMETIPLGETVTLTSTPTSVLEIIANGKGVKEINDINGVITNYNMIRNGFEDCNFMRLPGITSFPNVQGFTGSHASLYFPNATGTFQILQFNQWTGEEFEAPSTSTLSRNIWRTNGVSLKKIIVGTITSASGIVFYNPENALRVFSVGVGTSAELRLNNWTATNVIAEGQTGIDELNYNIKTYLADRVADRTGDSALTVTFGASLYNVLTPATIAAFTAKNWSVASA